MESINIYSVKLVKDREILADLPNKYIKSPETAYDFIEKVFKLSEEPSEKFGIIALATKGEVAGIHILFVGSLNATVVRPCEVIRAAFLNNAAAFICFHNHPSGDPTPSPQDVQVTKTLHRGGKLMRLEMFDHIIIGDGKFHSMKENGDF